MNTAITQGSQMYKYISLILTNIYKPIAFIGVKELYHALDFMLL